MDQITLYYCQGSSDKVYQAAIEPTEGGYLVTSAYGRRGATLSTGNKTPVAVDYGAAKAIYEKLLKEKMAKGYTPGEDGVPYQHTEKINTGVYCQLLNPIDSSNVEKLICNTDYWMQEKFDGRRLLIRKEGNTVTGINRLGLAVAVPDSLRTELARCSFDVILDGEAVGDTYAVFDILSIENQSLAGCQYLHRFGRLMNLLATFSHLHIQVAKTHCSTEEKWSAFHSLKTGGSEGVVFKEIHSHYTPGRPNSGGSQLKYKFVETASFIVGKANDKRSILLLLFEGDKIKQAGNVTIPPNHDVPSTGQVIECRYLYALPESGAIYQPVYLGLRDDQRAEECTTAQLKYKAAAQAA